MARKLKMRSDPIRSAAVRRSTYRRWRRWFDDIKNQIFSIHHRRHVYREVMAMVSLEDLAWLRRYRCEIEEDSSLH